MTQDAWVERLRSAEPDRSDAIEELRVILQRGLNRSLNVRYGVPFQIEDIVQEALLRIINSLDSFEGRSQFVTWAMTIATRVGISALRRKYRKEVSLDVLDTEDNMRIELQDKHRLGPSDILDQREVIQALNHLIDHELTARQRVAMRFLLEGIAVDEAAHRMQSNRNAVYKLVHDARLKLRHGLERNGFTMEHIQTIFAEGATCL
jgi:RNA polymerase sigma factor (sigma-70 family)